MILLRFLEEEAEQLRRVLEENAAEAKLKREQQIEREKAVSIYHLASDLEIQHPLVEPVGVAEY